LAQIRQRGLGLDDLRSSLSAATTDAPASSASRFVSW
jgi:hypothetical protein